MYELPGGHIDFGENMITGLKREILEEFGMQATIGDPFFVFTYSGTASKACLILLLKAYASKKPNIGTPKNSPK
jgi:8-oxo-dGTP pyrophosphatase MutT (NUDIX family)